MLNMWGLVFKIHLLICVFFNCQVFWFTFGCAGSSLLHGLFSSCGEWGLCSSCSAGVSHCDGFFCCAAQALGVWASVVAACELSGCGSRGPEHRFNSFGTWV